MTIAQASIATAEVQRTAMLLAAALGYARQGWLVLPLHTPTGAGCSCGRPCGSAGKHPRTRHGIYDASHDPAVIRAWWQRWQSANIGIATGRASSLLVLDLDAAHGGLQNLERLQRRFGSLPETLMAASGSGGLHLYFAWPAGVTRLRNAVALAGRTGVDVRVQGGCIVAPPSLHASGAAYTWLTWGTAPAPVPERWVRLLATRHQPRPRRAWSADRDPATLPQRWLEGAIRRAHPGERNALGFWLACRLVEAGVEPSEAERIMRCYAQAVGQQGEQVYTVEEALASLRSAGRSSTRS